MRLTHLWTALLLGIALTLTACGNEAEVDQWSNSPLAVICADEDDSGSEVSLNEDYYLVIILERHPRLGYYWSLSDSYSESILHLIGSDYQPYEPPGLPETEFGVDIWTFQAVGPGATNISIDLMLEYEIWGTFNLSVIVE